MRLTKHEDRAVKLAEDALEFYQDGDAESASKALKEAVALSPETTAVREAFKTIHSNDAVHPFYRVCRKLVIENNEEAGKEATSFLARADPITAEAARESLQLLLSGQRSPTCNLGLVDRIVTALLQNYVGAKTFLAHQLTVSTTTIFGKLYELGDGSAGALANIVLDVTAWSQTEVRDTASRDTAEKDVFRLFLAKLLEVGHDNDGKALKGIARLLMTDGEKLHSLLDQTTFDVILSCLDNRLSIEVRNQAKLATAKYLEASTTEGQRFLLDFIEKRVARQKKEDLIVAFSAAAAVFPLVTCLASSFFLTEGFVVSLVPILQKQGKSEKLEQAALELLSAACVDAACGQAIQKHCTSWLEQVAEKGTEKSASLAALVLAKLQGSQKQAANVETKQDNHQLFQKLKTMSINPTYSSPSQDVLIEGLAYNSSRPETKEELIKDTVFLESVVQKLSVNNDTGSGLSSNSMVIFGVLTIIDNLTRYLPTLSEEQKKMSQLKAYANASRSSADQSPLDSEERVKRRCTIIVNSTTLIPALDSSYKVFTASSIALMLSILRSLAWNQKDRGRLAQQGAAKLLLHTYISIAGTTPSDQLNRYTASHALARLLVSTNPTLIFPSSGSPPLVSTIRPIIALLAPPPEINITPSSTQRDLLPTWEALLALTNIASSPDNQLAEQITRLATSEIEELLLSRNTRISCAATELCLNLTDSPSGLRLFAESTPEAGGRLHILLALADSEDLPTRLAASGAIAGIVSCEGGVQNVVANQGGVKRLVALVEDEDEGCVHRGLMAVGCVAGWEMGAGKLREVDALGRIRQVVGGLEGELKALGREVVEEMVLRLEGRGS